MDLIGALNDAKGKFQFKSNYQFKRKQTVSSSRSSVSSFEQDRTSPWKKIVELNKVFKISQLSLRELKKTHMIAHDK